MSDDVEPDVGEVNGIDARPSAWVDSFTSDKDDLDKEGEEEEEGKRPKVPCSHAASASFVKPCCSAQVDRDIG